MKPQDTKPTSHPASVPTLRHELHDVATGTGATEWISQMSTLLQLRWPSIDPARLEDVAADLWRDAHLRSLDAPTAARIWLEPVAKRAA